jgi:DNA repair protein RecN (Recombination protein N)
MLTRLAVRDLAVIREADIEPGAGFTVLTGETGAGKSLLVDALGLVLGNRGAATLVRSGSRRAGVDAEFDLPRNESVKAILTARDLPGDDPITLHRQTGADGRSRAWVNGVPMPLSVLRELGETLAEIHGQHEHLALARPAHQRELLDGFAGTQSLAARVVEASAAVQDAGRALEQARANASGRQERLGFLRFQKRELDELAPREDEYAELHGEFEALRHRERSAEALATTFAALEEGEAPAVSSLATARAALGRLPAGAGFGEIVELLEQAESLAEEASRELHRLAEAEPDPDRLEWLNERIARYQSLARKHDVEPRQLASRHQALIEEFDALESGGNQTEALERALSAARTAYHELATQLGAKRAKAAPRFADNIARSIHDLGMSQARFEVTLEALDEAECPPGGLERPVFRIAANRGQAFGPISKIASGGELSRLALAVETLASADSGVPVMVFDEVDAGVSGRVAELVGRQLKALAAHRQVLCVTHLPQVAALADHHYSVSKTARDKTTDTSVEILDGEQRVEAIAAMLAGIEVGDTARQHARELIEAVPKPR